MEGQHQRMDSSVIVDVAAHRRQHKSMGIAITAEACLGTPATNGGHMSLLGRPAANTGYVSAFRLKVVVMGHRSI